MEKTAEADSRVGSQRAGGISMEDLANALGRLSLGGPRCSLCNRGLKETGVCWCTACKRGNVSESRYEEVISVLEKDIGDMVEVKTELEKLVESMIPGVTLDEICGRIQEHINLLDAGVHRSRAVVQERSPSPPLSQYWDWDEEQAFRERDFLVTDAEWADEAGVDWDEILDRRMN